MQRTADTGAINERVFMPNTAGPALQEEGAFCSTTSRIIIVSPFPASLHPLLTALAARCYDVMLFHHADSAVLSVLQGDLLVIDRTKRTGGEDQTALYAGHIPTLSLVSDEASAVGEDALVRDEVSAAGRDALVWPCSPEAALARIQAFIHRSSHSYSSLSEQLSYKDVALDLKRMTVRQAGRRVELTKTEFDLLKVLMGGGGQVLTRQELMDLVWGEEYFGGSNSVDVHIKSLRHKLGDDPKAPRYIATVRGVGYRLAD